MGMYEYYKKLITLNIHFIDKLKKNNENCEFLDQSIQDLEDLSDYIEKLRNVAEVEETGLCTVVNRFGEVSQYKFPKLCKFKKGCEL